LKSWTSRLATQCPVLEARYIERANQLRKCNLHESKLGSTKTTGSLPISDLAGSKPLHLRPIAGPISHAAEIKPMGAGFFTPKRYHSRSVRRRGKHDASGQKGPANRGPSGIHLLADCDETDRAAGLKPGLISAAPPARSLKHLAHSQRHSTFIYQPYRLLAMNVSISNPGLAPTKYDFSYRLGLVSIWLFDL
jgi:hypothetical protein